MKDPDQRLTASVVKRLGGVVVVLAVSLAIGEVVLRVINHFRPSYVYYDASYNRFRGVPGSLKHGYPINQRGFHDHEFSVDKGSTYRILALGDSFAFGVVPYPHNYLTLLEERLHRSGAPVEVLNFGIPRTGPTEQLTLLATEGLTYQPDLVLVSFFVGNDFLDQLRVAQARKSLADRSFVLSLLKHAVRVGSSLEGGNVYGDKPYDDAAPTLSEHKYLEIVERRSRVFRRDWKPFESAFESAVLALEEILRLCSDRDVPVTVVLCPDEIQVNHELQNQVLRHSRAFGRRNTDFSLPNRLLFERLVAVGIDALDLYEPLLLASAQEQLYKPRDTHWNIAGNRVVAELIGNHLQVRYLED